MATPDPNLLDICFNLWLIVDKESAYIYSYMGKAYALRGTDDEKLKILQALTVDDHHTVPRRKLPDRFVLHIDGQDMLGVTTLEISRRPDSGFFDELLDQLEKELPKQPRFFMGKTLQYPIPVSKSPLCVTTVLLEDEHGLLHPQVKPDGHLNS
jgi:hypothetical protein